MAVVDTTPALKISYVLLIIKFSNVILFVEQEVERPSGRLLIAIFPESRIFPGTPILPESRNSIKRP